MRFVNRWEEVDDGVWATKDDNKHKNGALIVQLDKSKFAMITLRLFDGDILSLQTGHDFPKSLQAAKELAEEFIEKLDNMCG